MRIKKITLFLLYFFLVLGLFFSSKTVYADTINVGLIVQGIEWKDDETISDAHLIVEGANIFSINAIGLISSITEINGKSIADLHQGTIRGQPVSKSYQISRLSKWLDLKIDNMASNQIEMKEKFGVKISGEITFMSYGENSSINRRKIIVNTESFIIKLQ